MIITNKTHCIRLLQKYQTVVNMNPQMNPVFEIEEKTGTDPELNNMDTVTEEKTIQKDKCIQNEKNVQNIENMEEVKETNQIEKIDEISKVSIRGLQEKEVEISVDMHKIEALKLGFNDIAGAIANENVTISGGDILVGGTYKYRF